MQRYVYFFRKKVLTVLFMELFLIIGAIETVAASLQITPIAIKGKVVDENDDPLPGATIAVKGTPRGVLSDVDGSFNIDVPAGSVLDISYVGYQVFSVVAMESSEVYVKLNPQTNELEEVTVVGFGRQKKESVISSIQTVNVKDLQVPSSNLTTAFSGRIAGLISYQTPDVLLTGTTSAIMGSLTSVTTDRRSLIRDTAGDFSHPSEWDGTCLKNRFGKRQDYIDTLVN
jgi:hypothetical protein